MSADLTLAWSQGLDEPVAEASWGVGPHLLAAGGVEGHVLLIDAEGSPARRWRAHEEGLFQCAFSPSEPLLATAGGDGFARIWTTGGTDAPPGAAPELLGQWKAPAPWVEHLRWRPQGGAVCVAAGRIWALWSGGEPTLLPAPAKTIAGLAWNPDGSVVAAAAYGRILLAGHPGGRLTGTLDWSAAFTGLVWSPDGRWIAASTGDSTVQIWERPFRPGEELAMSGFPGKVRAMAWHSSGKYLVTAAGTELMVWDCSGPGPSGREPRTLPPHPDRVSAVAYQRDGHLLASGDRGGRIRLWNARKSLEPLAEALAPAGVTCLSWSPDGRLLAVGDESGRIAALRAG